MSQPSLHDELLPAWRQLQDCIDAQQLTRYKLRGEDATRNLLAFSAYWHWYKECARVLHRRPTIEFPNDDLCQRPCIVEGILVFE